MSDNLAVSRIAVQGPALGAPQSWSSPAGSGAPSATNEQVNEIGSSNERLRVDLATATERLNRAAKALASELRFVIHAATHQIMVRVIDGDGNVIREIPPERVLDAYARMMETLGLLVDEKV